VGDFVTHDVRDRTRHLAPLSMPPAVQARIRSDRAAWATRTATTHVAEGVAVDRVATDPSVLDTEPTTLYGDSVQHSPTFSPADSASRKGRSRGDAVATSAVTQRREARIAQERAVLPQKPGTAGGDGQTCCTASVVTAESSRERLAFLRRVQYVDPRERRA